MAKVKGLGGIFFKTRDPQGMKAWYVKHLGITPEKDGEVLFRWRDRDDPERVGYTVWSPFPQDTGYFGPGTSPYMVNFRVDDLDGLLRQLREAGVKVEERVEESEFGRFGWFTDPDGNRVELWEPPPGSQGTNGPPG